MRIEQGVLVPSTMAPVGEGITGANYAIVVISGLSQRCVVKPAGDREIAAECFCALLGESLGLPTLLPVVVTDPRDQSLWFGSRDAAYPSLSSQLRIGAHANASQMYALSIILSKWAQIGQAVSFDELIANGDRNPGNVLWNGSQFTIIDHERTLGIQEMTQNRLAFFATNQFNPQLVASVQSASTSAALAQQALVSADEAVWSVISTEFLSLPQIFQDHCATFDLFARKNVQNLVSRTANSMTPLFSGASK